MFLRRQERRDERVVVVKSKERDAYTLTNKHSHLVQLQQLLSSSSSCSAKNKTKNTGSHWVTEIHE